MIVRKSPTQEETDRLVEAFEQQMGICKTVEGTIIKAVVAMGPLPDPTVKMDTTNLRQEREDRARELMDTEAESTLAILYQALYARGMRIGTVQQDIKRALEKEEKGAG